MYQLVGLRGSRSFLVLQLLQLMSVFGLAVFALAVLLNQLGLVSVSIWYSSLVLIPVYVLIAIWVGLFWRTLSGAGMRLGQPIKWQRIFLALGIAVLGCTVTHIWLVINHSKDIAPGRSLVFLPACFALITAFVLLAPAVIRSARKLQSRLNGIQERQCTLSKLRDKYDPAALERIQLSCDIDFGNSVSNPLSSPKGEVLYGLSSKPSYDVSEFPWIRKLEENFQAIRQEAQTVLSEDGRFRPYVYQGVSKGGWASFSFVSEGEVVEENCKRCPVTAALLRQIPGYPHFRDAMFSLLEPGREIPPHRDFHNIFLTCHFALCVPGNGAIKVAGMEKSWQEGQSIVFDSSFEHTAWNHSDSNRLVLLIDFLHPDINDAELEWLDSLGIV